MHPLHTSVRAERRCLQRCVRRHRLLADCEERGAAPREREFRVAFEGAGKVGAQGGIEFVADGVFERQREWPGQLAKELGRLPYSRASFERVPHLVGALYLAHRAKIEDEVMSEMEIPSQARAVTVSLDRASVPMEEPMPKGPRRPRKDAPKVK